MAGERSQLSQLQEHLNQVQQQPSTQLDQKLVDTAIYALPAVLSAPERQGLIFQLYGLLPGLQQDPKPAIRLLSKLLEPIPLSVILDFEPQVELVAGLDLQASLYHNLTLSLLEKADSNSARSLASTYPNLFVSLVVLWLSAVEEGVADQAGKVLVHLLKVDLPDANPAGLDGSVWKRIFRDKGVYQLLFALPDVKSGTDTSLSKTRKSIAQARLLDWLPVVGALNWVAIAQSNHPDVEAQFCSVGEKSLLHYAAFDMVDSKTDVLMHRTLMAFYEALLEVNPERSLSISPGLDYLVKSGLHKRTINYYVNPNDPLHDPLDVQFLYRQAALYTAKYVDLYPQHFADSNKTLRDKTLNKIAKAMYVEPSRWNPSHPPAEDLNVLSALPRTLLAAPGEGNDNPVLSVPTRRTNSDGLNCLATIFHGPIAEPMTVPPTPPKANEQDEIRAAQTIYRQFLERNGLWKDIVAHASKPALTDTAIAAINLIKAIITARWNGIEAMLEGDAYARVVPWLLAESEQFFRGGRGNEENAAYKVHMARADAQRVFWKALEGMEGYEDIRAQVHARLVETGARQGEVGGRIGTLEG